MIFDFNLQSYIKFLNYIQTYGYCIYFFFFIPLSFAAPKENCGKRVKRKLACSFERKQFMQRGKENEFFRRHECRPLCPPSNRCGKSKLDADALLHAAIGGRPFTPLPHRMSAWPTHTATWCDACLYILRDAIHRVRSLCRHCLRIADNRLC